MSGVQKCKDLFPPFSSSISIEIVIIASFSAFDSLNQFGVTHYLTVFWRRKWTTVHSSFYIWTRRTIFWWTYSVTFSL